MRLFVDSSILFSMCYSKSGGARELVRIAIRGRVEIVVSDYVFEETALNLGEKAADKVAILEYLRQREFWHVVNPTRDEVLAAIGITADKLDAPIVAAAKKAAVDALLSFDRKHLHTRAAVITPETIIKQIRSTKARA